MSPGRTIAQTCAALEAESERALAALREAFTGPVVQGDAALLDHLGRCVPAGPGAWLVEVREVTMQGPTPAEDPDGAPSFEGTARVAIAYVLPGGVAARYEPLLHDGQPGVLRFELEEHTDAYGGAAIDRVIVEQTFDFDGDGHEEAWVARRSTWPRPHVLLRFARHGTAGAIEEVEAASRLRDDLRDVDGDGRPDIVTIDPYRWEVDCSGEATYPDVVGLPRARHADASGAFVDDTPRARALLTQHCAGVAAPDADDHEDVIAWIGCQRFRGASAEAVVAALRRALRGVSEADLVDCLSFSALEDIAGVDPPFVLD